MSEIQLKKYEQIYKEQNPLQKRDMLRILVAEDEEIQSQLIRVTLTTEMGIELKNIVFCQDGQEALEQIKDSVSNNNGFNLLILDYNMPFLSGLDVIKQSKTIYQTAKTKMPKVLMLTAIEDTRLKNSALRAKLVDFFLTKPCSSYELDDVISQL